MSFLKLIQLPITVPSQSVSILARTFASRTSIIEKRLGLPEKPKRPLFPYNIFFMEKAKQLGNDNMKNHMANIAAEWRNLDPTTKSKYTKQCEKEIAIYKQKLTDYNNKITKEQKAQMKFERKILRDEENAKREHKDKKNLLNELGKPKKPLSAFFLFAKQLRSNSSGKLIATDITKQWNALNESQRKVYVDKSNQLLVQYEQDLLKWEQQMLKEGKVDLVRQKSITTKSTKSKSSQTNAAPKSKKPE